tara:strand:+ start:32211 stop:33458 length:1248 start_codon:yes stop_codon:yes gene_type:complete
MSLVDGFRQGFGMMSDYYNRKDAKEYRQEQLGLQRRRMNMAEESHNANMETAGLNTQILQNQVNDLPAATKYRNTMRGLEVRGQQLSVDGQETQNEINDFKLGAAKTNQGYKDEDRKKQKLIERAKAYYAAEDYEGFARDRSFAGTDLELLQDREGMDAITDLNMAIELGDNVGIVSSANRLFKPKLNRNVGQMEGRNGGVIKDITILDFVQQQDGSFRVPVRVTTDKGTYNSYISEMRGIDPNDPDKKFTADELFGKAAVMGNFASRMKASGTMDKVRSGLENYFAPQGGRGNGIPAKVQEMEYTRRLLGDEQYKQWLMFGRGKSPQELGMAAYKLASDTLEGVYFDSPEEKKAAVDQMTTELVSKFSQPTQSGTPQPDPTPAPAPDAAIQALRQDPSLADEFKAKYNYLPEGF